MREIYLPSLYPPTLSPLYFFLYFSHFSLGLSIHQVFSILIYSFWSWKQHSRKSKVVKYLVNKTPNSAAWIQQTYGYKKLHIKLYKNIKRLKKLCLCVTLCARIIFDLYHLRLGLLDQNWTFISSKNNSGLYKQPLANRRLKPGKCKCKNPIRCRINRLMMDSTFNSNIEWMNN